MVQINFSSWHYSSTELELTRRHRIITFGESNLQILHKTQITILFLQYIVNTYNQILHSKVLCCTMAIQFCIPKKCLNS